VSFLVQNGDEPRTAGSSDNSDTSALVLDTAYYVVTLKDSVFDPPNSIFNEIYDFLGATDVYDSACIAFVERMWVAGIIYMAFVPMRIDSVIAIAMAGAVPNGVTPYVIIPARNCDVMWLHNVDTVEARRDDWLVILRLAVDSAGELEAGVFGKYVDWTGTEFENYMRSHLSWYGGVGLSDASTSYSLIHDIYYIGKAACLRCNYWLDKAKNDMDSWWGTYGGAHSLLYLSWSVYRYDYIPGSSAKCGDCENFPNLISNWIRNETLGLTYSAVAEFDRLRNSHTAPMRATVADLLAYPNTPCSSNPICSTRLSTWITAASPAQSDFDAGVKQDLINAGPECDMCISIFTP